MYENFDEEGVRVEASHDYIELISNENIFARTGLISVNFPCI
jgi:hypothetical protein